MGIFISFPLWTQDRLFPLLPVFKFLNLPSFIGNYLIYVLLGVLTSLLFFPKKITVSLALLLLLALGLEDQMRWQPWVYIYLLFFLGFIFRIPPSNRLFYFRLLLISIYFWSGIHKINSNFVDHIFIPMARDVFMLHLPKYRIIGYGVSLLEISIGIGLAFKLTQRYAFFALCALHMIILSWVSPWGKTLIR
ncbi:DoxX family membrane protein [Mesonia ostreae]|uniref:DoxX family membrane protein n=1 Tax=Mesonia ostreae TaxID=861110 RepID=A0ABU2KGG0_9FLAO|nr:DoxX family membrane protein [Mesonia ostreae]MDT0293801.1 DoxX family membrane protein [Mesonia ostreae]